MKSIRTVPLELVHQELRFKDPIALPANWRGVPLASWKMDADGLILRQLFRQFRPMRHLEFGTWTGEGVLRVVEECDATVWTINLLAGETKPNGEWAYGTLEGERFRAGTAWSDRQETEDGIWIRTDAYGQIGRNYLEAGWGKRVCQIYADSREWDTSAYPKGFFDTCLIDGGHSIAIVDNDTSLAVRLVRPGGLVMWHDFCPDPDVLAACDSTRDVTEYVTTHHVGLSRSFDKLFWVSPSWLLIGVRNAHRV